MKVQELRLYETVLTQRIHSIKSIANDTPIPDIKVRSIDLIQPYSCCFKEIRRINFDVKCNM